MKEILEESAPPTVNYIKMSHKGVEVRKRGLVNVHMVFEQGKKNMTYIYYAVWYASRWGLQQQTWSWKKQKAQ